MISIINIIQFFLTILINEAIIPIIIVIIKEIKVVNKPLENIKIKNTIIDNKNKVCIIFINNEISFNFFTLFIPFF